MCVSDLVEVGVLRCGELEPTAPALVLKNMPEQLEGHAHVVPVEHSCVIGGVLQLACNVLRTLAIHAGLVTMQLLILNE